MVWNFSIGTLIPKSPPFLFPIPPFYPRERPFIPLSNPLNRYGAVCKFASTVLSLSHALIVRFSDEQFCVSLMWVLVACVASTGLGSLCGQRIPGSIKHGVTAVSFFMNSVVRPKRFPGAMAFLLCAVSSDTEFFFSFEVCPVFVAEAKPCNRHLPDCSRRLAICSRISRGVQGAV